MTCQAPFSGAQHRYRGADASSQGKQRPTTCLCEHVIPKSRRTNLLGERDWVCEAIRAEFANVHTACDERKVSSIRFSPAKFTSVVSSVPRSSSYSMVVLGCRSLCVRRRSSCTVARELAKRFHCCCLCNNLTVQGPVPTIQQY